ncbi:MAG: MaoC family dehydratase [Elusimicrobiota bacterium]
MLKSKSFNELKIGETESLTLTLSESRVNAFAEATGDHNPIHMDEDYAASTPFKKRVAHGVMLTGIVSGILGTGLPGLGTVARQMNAKFKNPAFIEDTVTASVTLKKKNERSQICEFSYKVTNQEGKILVRGSASVIPKREE